MSSTFNRILGFYFCVKRIFKPVYLFKYFFIVKWGGV